MKENKKETEKDDDREGNQKKEDMYSYLSLFSLAFDALQEFRPHIVGPFATELEHWRDRSPEIVHRLRACNSGILEFLRYLKPKQSSRLQWLAMWTLGLNGCEKCGFLKDFVCRGNAKGEESEEDEDEEELASDDEEEEEEEEAENDEEEVEQEAAAEAAGMAALP